MARCPGHYKLVIFKRWVVLKDGKKIEIYYFRSGRQPDGLITDDEFTPYVFTDEVLTGIGWQVLGGPNSIGQINLKTIHTSKRRSRIPVVERFILQITDTISL